MAKRKIEKKEEEKAEKVEKKQKGEETVEIQEKEGKMEVKVIEGKEVSNEAHFKSIIEAIKIPSDTFKTEFEFEDRFKKMADFLLNDVVLVANGVKIRFLELEFYFTSDIHNDPFTHKDVIQQSRARWYFHKTGSNYKGGSYKGLDITIGNSEKEVGGILIRTIEEVESGKVVCGPSLTVDHIISSCKAKDIKDLVDNSFKGDISVEYKEGALLYLTTESLLPRREVFR